VIIRMFGDLFGEDDDTQAAMQDAEHELHNSAPPTPAFLVLRREISLSKNTLQTLEDRLHELQREQVESENNMQSQVLRLQSQIDLERLRHTETKTRTDREIEAIQSAIEKHKVMRAEEIKQGIAEMKDDERSCGVCLAAPRNTLIAPCGHIALCFECATAVHKSRNPECPFCRHRISAVYKTYTI